MAKAVAGASAQAKAVATSRHVKQLAFALLEKAVGAMPRRLRVLELGRQGRRRAAPRAHSHPPLRGEGVSRWSETSRG